MEMYIYKGMDFEEFKEWSHRRALKKRKDELEQKAFGLVMAAFGILTQVWMGCIEFAPASIGIVAVGILIFLEYEK